MTLNNPTPLECIRWNNVLLDGNVAEHASNLTFFIVQTERGENLVVHYQAYCEFKKAVEWSTLKKIFGDRIHIENSRGTAAANIRYCTKNQSRYTGGNVCVSGQWGTARVKGGLMLAAISISNGAQLEEVVENHPDLALMSMNKIESFIAYSKGHRKDAPKVDIYYGLTGCGKSQYCARTYGTSAYWVSPPVGGRVWFGHYVGQEVCIFDDFHAGWFTLTHLLRLLDSTPFMVEPKGGQVPFTSGHIVMTCNVDPRDWYSGYSGDSAHKDALERRIQDFADIYDCTGAVVGCPLGTVRYMNKVKRTNTFKFRENMGLDFSTPAGVGDQSSGNHFMF